MPLSFNLLNIETSFKAKKRVTLSAALPDVPVRLSSKSPNSRPERGREFVEVKSESPTQLQLAAITTECTMHGCI